MNAHSRLLPLAAALIWVPLAHAAAPKPAARVVALSVTEKGFEPAKLKVKKGEDLELLVTRKTEHTCATAIVLQGVETQLPLGKPVSIKLTPGETGTIKYACPMGMISGALIVE